MTTRLSPGLRTFYTLIITQTFSMIGSRISSLAIGIWVYNQTGNATPLALVSFFALLPSILASSISGVLADRWNRRYLMIFADVGQAVGTLLLFLSFLTDSFQLWHLYAITFAGAIFSVFQGPAFMASVTMLVPDSHRDRANAIQQLVGPMSGIIAPAIAGVVYAAVSVEGALIVDLVTFLVAIVVVLNVHIPQPESTAEGNAMRGTILRELMGGLEFLWSRKPLLGMMLYATLVNFLFGSAMTLLTPYLLARTGNEAALGLILSVNNLGGIIGGVVFGIWGGTRPRIHTAMIGLILAGLFMGLAGLGRDTVSLSLTLFLMMVPLPMVNAAMMSMLQVKVPPDIQGRVFAVISQIAMFLMPLGMLLVGPLVDNIFEPAVDTSGWQTVAPLVGNSQGAGMGLLMFGAGMLVFISGLFVYALPSIRHIEANLPDYTPTAADTKAELEVGLEGEGIAPAPAL